ncbi:MAG: RagB/SusD family nutrient uptake outer membrane protein, partial [Bacteroidaceae bacterium]|nr:RagB/SusD family nutrient uptake outer membrane protein [Bacteroidaceae bacterium]
LALRNDTVVPGNQDLRKSFELVKAVYYRSNPYKVTNADSLKYSSDPGTMQALVLEERQRELAFEGKRWYDLVRKALRDGQTNDMLDVLVDHKYETNQKAIRSKMAAIDCLFFPIYQREIETNPLLKQNPAYEVEDLYEKK